MKPFSIALTFVTLIIGLSWFAIYVSRNDLDSPIAAPTAHLPSRRPVKTYDFSQAVNAHEVVYQIQTNGCTDFDTTYQLPDGTSQSSTYTCSTTEVGHFQAHSGQFVYLSIQNSGDYNASGSATFSCNILVDGMPFKKVSSSGSHHIASCDGMVP